MLKPDFLRHSLDPSLNSESHNLCNPIFHWKAFSFSLCDWKLHAWGSVHFIPGNSLSLKNSGSGSVHGRNGKFRGFSVWSGVRFSNICHISWFVGQLGPIHQALLSLGSEFMFLIHILCPRPHQQRLRLSVSQPSSLSHLLSLLFFLVNALTLYDVPLLDKNTIIALVW